MQQEITVYVALLNEGTDVWRPVDAKHIEGDVYRIAEINSVPSDENWQFSPGDLVRCRERTFGDSGNQLVAEELIG